MKILKHTLLISCLLAASFTVLGQQKHFVYLQTEDLTPFYIQLNGKTISSTAAGYLLLGKLSDSIYLVKLGVLGSGDVQEYGIRVDGRDAGYIIKKSADAGWSITDINTNAMQMSMEWSAAVAAENARMRAMEAAEQQRIKDSIAAVRQAELDAAIALDKKRKEDSIQVATAVAAVEKPVTETNTVQVASSNPPAVVVPVVTVPAKPVEQKQVVTEEKKIMSPADSLALVIAQKEKELKDLQAALLAANEKKPVVVVDTSKPVVTTQVNVPATTAESKANKPALLDMEFSIKADSVENKITLPAEKDTAATIVVKVDSVGATPAQEVEKHVADTLTKPVAVVNEKPVEKPAVIEEAAIPTTDSVVSNSATAVKRMPCVEILSRSDVDAAMATNGKLTNADEIAAAYATLFKGKCVTTTNLKKICNSLASDVTRYKVLEAAYPFTLDYYAFAELSGLIKDSYYSKKFTSLIQQ